MGGEKYEKYQYEKYEPFSRKGDPQEMAFWAYLITTNTVSCPRNLSQEPPPLWVSGEGVQTQIRKFEIWRRHPQHEWMD